MKNQNEGGKELAGVTTERAAEAADLQSGLVAAGYDRTWDLASPMKEAFDQQVNTEWYYPRFGSDSLQHVIDFAATEIKRLQDERNQLAVAGADLHAALTEAVSAIFSGRLVSIGAMKNVYTAQVYVRDVVRWHDVLALTSKPVTSDKGITTEPNNGQASSPKCTCFADLVSQEHATYCPREGIDFDSPDLAQLAREIAEKIEPELELHPPLSKSRRAKIASIIEQSLAEQFQEKAR